MRAAGALVASAGVSTSVSMGIARTLRLLVVPAAALPPGRRGVLVAGEPRRHCNRKRGAGPKLALHRHAAAQQPREFFALRQPHARPAKPLLDGSIQLDEI